MANFVYYVPLTILKGMIGSTPLHVMADGSMKYDLEDDRMNDKIVEAIEMKHEIEKKEASL